MVTLKQNLNCGLFLKFLNLETWMFEIPNLLISKVGHKSYQIKTLLNSADIALKVFYLYWFQSYR